MKKRLLSTVLALGTISVAAKANLRETMDDILANWIEPAYPLIIAIVFIIGAISNLGKFTNAETRDIKGGIINISIWLIAVLAVGGLYAGIKGMSL